jgi:hypothetical protein
MCNKNSVSHNPSPASLHQKVCRATGRLPCRIAHLIGHSLKRLVGRPATSNDCCGGRHAESEQAAPQKLKGLNSCDGHSKHSCGCDHK